MNNSLRLAALLVSLFTSFQAVAFSDISACGGALPPTRIVDEQREFTFDKGEGRYRVEFNYTGENWTHADVAAIKVDTDKPIAILPMQYTKPGRMMPGATVGGESIGQQWNLITQAELAKRLCKLGFVVFTPSISDYGEYLDGYQAFEHFIAGLHKGNRNIQTILLTADAHNPNAQNPLPGAQMLVTGTNPRNKAWESLIQRHIAPFYEQVNLGNRGARVRGGHSDVEGSSAAWHPLIERAAEYGPTVSIMEVSRAIDIVEQAGSIEAGREWAAPLFDAIALAMKEYACQDESVSCD
ncbi:hypothetical protein AWR36_000275 [Microbulbifer flavimaris]|uniref:N-acetylmuramoyl-L-alanine amidase n=1 Tax=Microbulbifer flavimaris TaxID=1781068 RepID=A0ABX4I1G8_9GAMM|nr:MULTISPECIES: hypothetical protein [Microbulbifer]KUJ84190.1 hypothetical protein AVO43_00280 [Microbulbifer sp. ZGT114]PCO06264.1 hypothetical protein AWR36_000275 [Microbulbifer flavimaris]